MKKTLPRKKLLNLRKIPNLTLSTVSQADSGFIEKVYLSTRFEEFTLLGWPPAQTEAFLKTQLEFQQKSYEMQFPGAENYLIKLENESVGRLIIDRTENENRLVDIALLPEFRGRGIASAIINDLMEEAAKEGKKLALQVLKTNQKAFKLYQKLGLRVTAEDEFYYSMEK